MNLLFEILFYILKIPNLIGLIIFFVIKIPFLIIHLIINFLKLLLRAVWNLSIQIRNQIVAAANLLLTTSITFYRQCKTSVLSFFTEEYRLIRSVVIYSILAGMSTSVTVIGWRYFEQLPYPTTLTQFSSVHPVLLYDENQIPVYEQYTTPVSFPSSETLTSPASYSFDQAVGIDWLYIGHALFALSIKAETPDPRSISHHLAQQFLDSTNDSLGALIKEIATVVKINQAYSKEDQRSLYIATMVIGDSIGLEQAANQYFGARPSHLNGSQIEYLHALSLHQTITLPATVTRQQQKKQALNTTKLITFLGQSQPHALSSTTPITTTLDLTYQNKLQQLIIEQYAYSAHSVPQLAILVTERDTGAIKALTGNHISDEALAGLLTTATQNHRKVSSTFTDLSLIPGIPLPESSKLPAPASQIISTYTTDLVITLWIDPQVSTQQPQLAQSLLDSITNKQPVVLLSERK